MRARFLDLISGGRRGLPLALALVALVAASPAQAASVNFLQLGSTVGEPLAFSSTGGSGNIMLNAAPITFIANGLPGIPNNSTVNATISVLAFVSNETQTTLPGGTKIDTATINGALMIASGGTTYLSASFTSATFSGIDGGTSATLSGTTPGTTITYASSLPGFSYTPTSFSVDLVNITNGLSFVNNNITSFNSDINGGGFNGIPGGTPSVPEPASVAMVGTGLAATGLLVLRRKRRPAGEPCPA